MLLGGRWQIVEEIGRGGQGVVVRVRDTRGIFDVDRAAKIASFDSGIEELRALVRVRDRNVVSYYEVDIIDAALVDRLRMPISVAEPAGGSPRYLYVITDLATASLRDDLDPREVEPGHTLKMTPLAPAQFTSLARDPSRWLEPSALSGNRSRGHQAGKPLALRFPMLSRVAHNRLRPGSTAQRPQPRARQGPLPPMDRSRGLRELHGDQVRRCLFSGPDPLRRGNGTDAPDERAPSNRTGRSVVLQHAVLSKPADRRTSASELMDSSRWLELGG